MQVLANIAPLPSQLYRFYHHVRHYIEEQPIQSHDRTKMTSVNTPEEQAIAFLLTCVENSQKGKVCNIRFQARSLPMSPNSQRDPMIQYTH